MVVLPTGTVTFLFTDIEGSTTLLQNLGDRRYAEVLAEHQRLLRDVFTKGNGQEIDTQGDAFLVAFSRARDAVAAAVAAQRALISHPWPDGTSLRVRMGLHTGEPVGARDRYVGLDLHRAARICAAGHGGQILLSDAVSGLAARDLPPGVTLRDLGTHRLKDLREPEHLLQVLHPELLADFPALKSLDARPNNLPAQLTSFIGRTREIADVERLLPATRILTLTGAGGSGKTRLALRVAGDLLDHYPDGVWFVELASLSDPALVPKAVASALDVPEQPGRHIQETLASALRPRRLLLVLDNCEHLLSACQALAADLLRACPNLRVLATSRETLQLDGELTYPVPSLQLPDLHRLPPVAELAQCEAVRLFAERAAFNQPRFALTDNNASVVAQICHRLDGIPLAIEFAAARVKVLSVDQIAARLDDRFRLLTAGTRKTLPRHQTLRAVMDWSYGLLGERERAAFRQLSVFAGGFTLEAAEAICKTDGAGAGDVLDLITQLVDKSLIVAGGQDGGMRYRLLETVRQYARDRLLEVDDAAAVRTRHRDFFLAIAEDAGLRLLEADEAVLLERLETEHDNLRAALAWSLEAGDANRALRLAATLGTFWYRNAHWAEGREWLARALEAGAGAEPGLKAKTFSAAANLAWAQGDLHYARDLYEQALAFRTQLDDKRGIADARLGLGSTSYFSGDNSQALVHFQESLRLFREVGNRRGVASALQLIGWVAMTRGAFSEAAQYAEESIALFRAIGNRRWTSQALVLLGAIACTQGAHERAAALLEESIAISQEVKDRHGVALGQAHLAHVVRVAGDHRKAVALLHETIRAYQQMGNRRLVGFSLEELATINASTGDAERAAKLFGAAEGLREAGSSVKVTTFYDHAQGVAATREALGEAQFAAAWAAGRAMTVEQAMEYALKEGTPAEEAHGSPPKVATE